MAEIKLSVAARADLTAIDEWGAGQFGEDVADQYSRGFNDAFALLAQHPQTGAVKAELGEGIRCLIHKRHRIFYRVEDGIVLIIRIAHHAQDTRLTLKKAVK